VTTLSSNLARMGRLEIGRYDRTSDGSRSAFLSSGVMYVVLRLDGTMPCSRDWLMSRHRNGETSSTFLFNSHAGSRSSREYLSGSDRTRRSTSAVVTGSNDTRAQPSRTGENVGGTASAVAERTPATFSLKKRWC